MALTGNIAAGKSTVAQLLRSWGAVLFDADEAVRVLQRPGSGVFAAIVAHFGRGVVRADGGLDRVALRDRILADPAERAALEAIVHPAVEARRLAAQEAAAAAGAAVFVADIPLLFESADPAAYDGVILVDAPAGERRRRLINARRLSPLDADRLIAAQMPAAAKRALATWIIDNDADRATLMARTRAVWDAVMS
ncbi:MAG: dephospho-CoA kinase [Gemmatimonadetes bacterium]|nr:dephospho-CoA kinase [Gemmatimonadota bacterium]